MTTPATNSTRTTTHTPGPWAATKARKSSNFGGRTAFVQASVSVDGKPTFYFTVAKVLGGPRDESSLAEANARLIAAAPDLLNALRMAAAFIDQRCVRYDDDTDVPAIARAAILRATGERG